LLAVYLGVRLF